MYASTVPLVVDFCRQPHPALAVDEMLSTFVDISGERVNESHSKVNKSANSSQQVQILIFFWKIVVFAQHYRTKLPIPLVLHYVTYIGAKM